MEALLRACGTAVAIVTGLPCTEEVRARPYAAGTGGTENSPLPDSGAVRACARWGVWELVWLLASRGGARWLHVIWRTCAWSPVQVGISYSEKKGKKSYCVPLSQEAVSYLF